MADIKLTCPWEAFFYGKNYWGLPPPLLLPLRNQLPSPFPYSGTSVTALMATGLRREPRWTWLQRGSTSSSGQDVSVAHRHNQSICFTLFYLEEFFLIYFIFTATLMCEYCNCLPHSIQIKIIIFHFRIPKVKAAQLAWPKNDNCIDVLIRLGLGAPLPQDFSLTTVCR